MRRGGARRRWHLRRQGRCSGTASVRYNYSCAPSGDPLCCLVGAACVPLRHAAPRASVRVGAARSANVRSARSGSTPPCAAPARARRAAGGHRPVDGAKDAAPTLRTCSWPRSRDAAAECEACGAFGGAHPTLPVARSPFRLSAWWSGWLRLGARGAPAQCGPRGASGCIGRLGRISLASRAAAPHGCAWENKRVTIPCIRASGATARFPATAARPRRRYAV